MKRNVLILLALFIGGMSFGQEYQKQAIVPYDDLGQQNTSVKTMPTKGGGDVIWQTTFDWANPDDPRGWSLPEGWVIGDNSDLGNYWIWGIDSLDEGYGNRAAPSYFETKDDGFVYMPIRAYNSRDGVETRSAADSYIQTEAIDCSASSSVVVRFSQKFRLCCSNYNLEMLVSSDDGVHWASYDVRFGVAGNLTPPERFQTVEINVSDVAAGAPGVLVKFYMWGMENYYWVIDDLALVESYDNDLVLEDTWMEFDGGSSATIDQINYWPLSQMGMAGEPEGVVGNLFMKGAVLNKGMADSDEAKIELSVVKNGTEVFNTSSETKSIWSLDRDTMLLETYLADDYGDYRFDFTAVDDNVTEEVSVNNTASMYFTVNDTLSHRSDFSAESHTSTGGWTGGGNAGDMVCVFYNLYEPAKITSITAQIGGFTAEEEPEFQFVLMKDVDGEMEEWCVSDIFAMDSSYRYSSVTLPILEDGESEFLEAGEYATCVRMWGYKEDDENGTQGMTVGRDLSTKFSGCPQYYEYGDSRWHGLAGSPLFMIGYSIDATGGPTEAAVTFNVDMNAHIASGEFTPGTDFVDVAGTFNDNNGSEPLTDEDGDGIYTLTLDAFEVSSKIEYRYRINGSWDTAEFMEDERTRKYTVRYWNILDDVYNGGETVGVEDISLIESMSVYPNPTAGEFTVRIVNTEVSDMAITLMDIQGHVVYKNVVSGAITHTELINKDLTKGVYFLTINNGKEVKVQKVIVK